jgi:co-chaperonin GroES (HSP10)
MLKPVNGHVSVEVVEREDYVKSKGGILISSSDIEANKGPVLIIDELADDVKLPIVKGQRVMLRDRQLLFFMGDDDRKMALIHEESIAAIYTD